MKNKVDPLNAYTNTKWYIKSIIKDRTGEHKLKKIKAAIKEFNTTIGNSDIPHLSSKGKIYLHLYRNENIRTIFLLESLQAMGIRKYLPTRIINFAIYLWSRTDIFDSLSKEKRKIVVTLVPDHGNLGDLAIGHAQRAFLEDNFKDHEVIELPIGKTYHYLKSLKKKMTRDDIIMINGGGNLGNLYREEEGQRRFIIKLFPDNKIVSFPQSIFFTYDEDGRRSQQATKKVYESHQNLTLVARDQASYEIMHEIFNLPIKLIPDTVLYLKDEESDQPRKKNQITLSIRRDIESKLTNTDKEAMIKKLEEAGKTIVYKDTNVDNIKVDIAHRKKYLDEIWNLYRESEAVITDRLHGVIFCVITKTPCIAINNNNGKVSNLCSTWLNNSEYVTSLNSFDAKTVEESLNKLLKIKSLSQPSYDEHFKKLQQIIES